MQVDALYLATMGAPNDNKFFPSNDGGKKLGLSHDLLLCFKKNNNNFKKFNKNSKDM
jgi:hypothetical protein